MAHSPIESRIVVLIDMDCFYVQVEQRRDPSVRGKPCAVVQYNKWKGGGIIAVGYEARAKGVTRQMRGDDAAQKCPEITLLRVPTANGKADLTRYRDAGAEVIQVLLQFGGVVERASIDEAYIDLTDVVNEKLKRNSSYLPQHADLDNTHVVGFPKQEPKESDSRLQGLTEFLASNIDDPQVARLAFAASIVEEMRLAIYQQTSFRCSAGIAHNKMLSKLACGINKPNKQTILPFNQVEGMFKNIKIRKIRNLGGKLGASLCTNFNVEFAGQVAAIPVQSLVAKFGQKTGHWLSEVCRGVDHEPIKERHVAQSVGCSKNFPGAESLNSRSKVERWTSCLATELVERLAIDKLKNDRVAHGLTLHVGYQRRNAISRSTHIDRYEVDHVTKCCLATLELLNESPDRQTDAWVPPITMLGISSKNFKDMSGNESGNVKNMLRARKLNKSPTKKTQQISNDTNVATGKQQQDIPNSGRGVGQRNGHHRTSMDAFLQSTMTSQEPTRSAATNDAKPPEQCPVHGAKDPEPQPPKEKPFFRRMAAERLRERFAAENLLFERQNADQVEQQSSFQTGVAVQKPIPIPVEKEDRKELETESRSIWNKNVEEYCSTEIDQEVLASLPLYLQHEIRSAMGESSSAKTKKRPSTSSTPGASEGPIAKFFRPTKSPSPATSPRKRTPAVTSHVNDVIAGKTQQTKKQKKATPKSKTKKKPAMRVDNSQSVPLGFFRARSQASAAIRNAIKMQTTTSTKLPAPVRNKSPNTAASVDVSPGDGLNQSPVQQSKSLWSSIVDQPPSFRCPDCNTMVPISDVSAHSDFHERESRARES